MYIYSEPDWTYFIIIDSTVNSQVERCKIKNTKLQELAKSSDKSTASEFRDLKKGSIKL